MKSEVVSVLRDLVGVVLMVILQGQQHNHAFLSRPTNTRVARVVLARGQLPHVSVGIRFVFPIVLYCNEQRTNVVVRIKEILKIFDPLPSEKNGKLLILKSQIRKGTEKNT